VYPKPYCTCAGGPHIHCKLRPVLDLLLAARPGARDYLSMRAFVAERLDDFDAARADLLALVGLLPAGPVVPQRLPADVQPAWARLAARERELLASCARCARPPWRPAPRFALGAAACDCACLRWRGRASCCPSPLTPSSPHFRAASGAQARVRARAQGVAAGAGGRALPRRAGHPPRAVRLPGRHHRLGRELPVRRAVDCADGRRQPAQSAPLPVGVLLCRRRRVRMGVSMSAASLSCPDRADAHQLAAQSNWWPPSSMGVTMRLAGCLDCLSERPCPCERAACARLSATQLGW